MMFKQVLLEMLDDQSGSWKHVSWIPEHLAHVGKRVVLRENDGSWSRPWTVKSVWTRATEEYVREHERDNEQFPVRRNKK